MSDRTQQHGTDESNAAPVSLGDALRALPQLAPAESAWAEMASRLARESAIASRETRARRPGPRRYVWPVGIAAAFVLAFSATAIFRYRPVQKPGPDVAVHSAATDPSPGASSVHNAANSTNSHEIPRPQVETLAPLQTRSRILEQWLRDTSAASAPQSAQDLAASAEIEDMIGLVDLQLGAADTADANAALPLWRRRVALLEDLSALRYGTNALSLHNGIAANGAPANEVNAAPAVWRN